MSLNLFVCLIVLSKIIDACCANSAYRGEFPGLEFPSAFEYSSTEAILKHSLGIKFYDLTTFSFVRDISIATTKDENGFVAIGAQYAIIFLDSNQFQVKLVSTTSQPIPFSPVNQVPYNNQPISLISTASKGYLAWVDVPDLKIYSFNTLTNSITSSYIVLSQGVKNNISCVGLTDFFICAYSIAISNTCVLQFSNGKTPVSSNTVPINECVDAVKVFRLNKIANKVVIYFIDINNSFAFLSGKVSSTSFSPEPIKKAITAGCQQNFNSFTFGKFHNGFAAVCTAATDIKLQSFDKNFNLIGTLITINKGSSSQVDIGMPSLVAFTSDKTGLFYANSNVSNKGIGYHILQFPICLNGIANDVVENVPKALPLSSLVGQLPLDSSMRVIFPTPSTSTMKLETPGNVLVIANNPYSITDTITYTSTIRADDSVPFKLINEEGLESQLCSIAVRKTQCYSTCSTCVPISTNPMIQNCDACLPGHYKKNGESTGNCYEMNSMEIGYYLDNNLYYQCDASCLKCETTSTNCLQCAFNYYPIVSFPNPGSCYNTATLPSTAQYYLDRTTKEYKLCDASCEYCLSSSTSCITCAVGYHKQYGDPIPNHCLPDSTFAVNYYLYSNEYKQCDSSCNGCISQSTDCSACASTTFHKIRAGGNECYSETSKASGYFVELDLYAPCHLSCESCKTNANNCLKCSSGYHQLDSDTALILNQCYDSASKQNGYYLDGEKYKPCALGCEECRTPQGKCTKCLTGYHQYLIDFLCYKDSLKVDHYFVNGDGFLQDCDVSCLTCELSPTNCLQCKNTYHKEGTTSSSTCYSEDSKTIGYYLDKVDNVYKQCDISCSTCATSPTQCIKCSPRYHLLISDPNPIKGCYEESTKTTGYYLMNDVYNVCGAGCSNCANNVLCTKCLPDHYYRSSRNSCVKTLASYYHNDNEWLACYTSCGSCSKGGTAYRHNCDTCKYDYYNAEGKGTDMCYLLSEFSSDYSIVNGVIVNIPPVFKKGKNCQRCPLGEYCLEETIQCIKKEDMPENGYVHELNNAINLCSPTCRTCSIVPHNCTSCVHTQYLNMNPPTCTENCIYNPYRIYYKDKEGFRSCLAACPAYTIFIINSNTKTCKICKDGEYYLDIPLGAVQTDCLTSKPKGTYVVDEEFNVLRACKDPCVECITSESNCTSCKAGYSKLIDNPYKCQRNILPLATYYYNSTNDQFEKCHQLCATCAKGAEVGNLNCATCISGYLINPSKKGDCKRECRVNQYFYIDKTTKDYICVNSCPSDYPILTNSIQCVANCKESNLQMFFYQGQCLQACPVNTIGTSEDLVCHALGDTADFVNSIGLMIVNIMNSRTRLRMLSGLEDYVKLISPSFKFQLFTYADSFKEEFLTEAVEKEMSLLDLTECVSYLKTVYLITKDDEIFIATFDIESPNVSPQIEYMIYSSDGKQLEMSYCNKSRIIINQPLDATDDIREAQDIYNASGYNILNSTDVFYRDICHRMKGPNDTDVLLESRFDYYYKNMSICEEGCSLTDVNLTNQRATCSCNCKTSFELTTEREFVPALAIRPNDTSLSYMKCYENVFTAEIFNGNIGNYLSLTMFVLQMGLCVFFCIQSNKIIALMISQSLSICSNPPRRVDQILNYIENQSDFDENVSSSIGDEDEVAERKDDKVNKEKKDQKEEKTETMKIGSDKDKTEGKGESQKPKDEKEVKGEEQSKDKLKGSLTANKKLIQQEQIVLHQDSQALRAKANVKFSDKVAKYEGESGRNNQESGGINSNNANNINSNQSHIQGDSTNLHFEGDSKELDKPFRREIKDESVKYGLTSLPMESSARMNYATIHHKNNHKETQIKEVSDEKRMKSYKNKPFFFIYLHFLQKRHRLINLIFSQDDYQISLIKLSYFLLSISFDFFFSVLFCLNSMIKYMFENNEIEMGMVIGFGILSPLIGYFLMKIIAWAMNSKSILNKLNQISKDDNDSYFRKALTKSKTTLKWKLVVYFTTMLFFIVLVWYTVTAFCGTFPNTQQLWGTMVGVSVGLSLALPFIYYFIVSAVLYLSVESNSIRLLNVCRLAVKV